MRAEIWHLHSVFTQKLKTFYFPLYNKKNGKKGLLKVALFRHSKNVRFSSGCSTFLFFLLSFFSITVGTSGFFTLNADEREKGFWVRRACVKRDTFMIFILYNLLCVLFLDVHISVFECMYICTSFSFCSRIEEPSIHPVFTTSYQKRLPGFICKEWMELK